MQAQPYNASQECISTCKYVFLVKQIMVIHFMNIEIVISTFLSWIFPVLCALVRLLQKTGARVARGGS